MLIVLIEAVVSEAVLSEAVVSEAVLSEAVLVIEPAHPDVQCSRSSTSTAASG